MTRYSKVELLSGLFNDIVNYDKDKYYHLICEDMNAHTEECDDCILFDENMYEQLDIDGEFFIRSHVKETMDNLNIPSHRKCVDNCKDRGNYGKALLELCRDHVGVHL